MEVVGWGGGELAPRLSTALSECCKRAEEEWWALPGPRYGSASSSQAPGATAVRPSVHAERGRDVKTHHGALLQALCAISIAANVPSWRLSHELSSCWHAERKAATRGPPRCSGSLLIGQRSGPSARARLDSLNNFIYFELDANI